MTPDIAAAIATIPALQGYTGPVERLGGLTNRVFRLGDACLRLPGAGTAAYINRADEAVAAAAAAEAGVAPALIHADPASGLMVTQFLARTTTMSPTGFRDPGTIARAGVALRRLHGSAAVFPFRFELFAMIDSYLGVLATKDVALPGGYHDVVAQAAGIRQVLATQDLPLAPCHCDPLCENFLDDGTQMWIVDWEYAGMNDPMWDLGDLSVEGGFDATQDAALLQAYFGGAPSPADHGRMVIYKAMCDLLWTLWGLIQLANDNPADDFRAYADGRFARCKTLMADPGFARHLAAAAG
jgi:thiamine kinase-like enzyme